MMKVVFNYFILFVFISSCSPKAKNLDKIYQKEFYSLNVYASKSDTLLISAINQVQIIKELIINDYIIKGKITPNEIAVIMILRMEYGGKLERYLKFISEKYSIPLDIKYSFSNDCESLSIDQALYYLTNIERDILMIIIQNEIGKE